jgi:integrase
MSFLPADLAPSTLGKKLSQIEAFYQHADEALGIGRLDDALAELDVDAICSALEAYFLTLRSRPITPATEERWQAARQFVAQTSQRITRGSLARERHDALSGRLMQIELLNAHLHVGRRRRPERIRSLPSEIVEALYEMLDPESSINPFAGVASRWRVYTIFMLLLHQGLRRGELLSFPVDVIKSGYDQNRQQVRYWMTVRYNEYQAEDPRYSKPSIKNAPSIRQIPVSKTTALLIQEYATNYRGKPDHSFLINSQKQSPLSTEGMTKLFQKITASLPKQLRKILIDHTGDDSLSPHDLRHTCAVVRLNQLLSSGVEMTDALERMRTFFGWSRDSDMPLRYARAVFEDRLSSVWNNKFDDRVEVLRSIPAGLK